MTLSANPAPVEGLLRSFIHSFIHPFTLQYFMLIRPTQVSQPVGINQPCLSWRKGTGLVNTISTKPTGTKKMWHSSGIRLSTSQCLPAGGTQLAMSPRVATFVPQLTDASPCAHSFGRNGGGWSTRDVTVCHTVSVSSLSLSLAPRGPENATKARGEPASREVVNVRIRDGRGCTDPDVRGNVSETASFRNCYAFGTSMSNQSPGNACSWYNFNLIRSGSRLHDLSLDE